MDIVALFEKYPWALMIALVILIAIGQTMWQRYSPGPRAASPPLYSLADLNLSPEEETFADEIITGLTRLQKTVGVCYTVDPARVKVSGTRETETGYIFHVRCAAKGQPSQTAFFNKDKVVSLTKG
jgi:hypothetical protein